MEKLHVITRGKRNMEDFKMKRRAVAFVMTLVMGISSMPMANCMVVKAEEAPQEYVVMAEDEAEYSAYTEEMAEGLDEIMSDIFAEEQNEIENGNISEPDIMPLWGGPAHESTVDSYGTNITSFMKVMCKVPDNDSYTLASSCNSKDYLGLKSGNQIVLSNGAVLPASDTQKFREMAVLHGRGNYVASLRFLYTVAYNLMNNSYSGTKIQKIQGAINDSLAAGDVANGTFYGELKMYANPRIGWVASNGNANQYIGRINANKPFSSLDQRLTLEKAIYIIANMHFEGQENAYTEAKSKYSNVTTKNAFETRLALKIIGMATHLCGDIYAHKTVVPLNVTFSATAVPASRGEKVIYRGTAVDFNGNGRWSAAHGIKKLVESGSTITTQQITEWQMNKGAGTDYPDEKTFYPDRLQIGSKQLVANMYDNFFNGKSLGNTKFYVNWFLHKNYTLRLANLKLYAYSIGSQPTKADRLELLNKLDSAVAMSDVVPANGYTLPGDAGSTWKKGIVSSY